MKKYILIALIALSNWYSQAQNVLYFCDGLAGTDQMAIALSNLGYNVTTVTTHAAFQSAIATPANFDLAIHFIQSNFPDAASVNAMANFMAIPGKKGMHLDWSMNNSYGTMFGVNFTGGTNNGTVTITDPGLAAGLTTNPFSVFQGGWGTYATGLIPLSGGTVMGTFSNGEAALVETMGGNMMVFGYTTDAVTSPEVFEHALLHLYPPIMPTITTHSITAGPLCQNEIVMVGFTVSEPFISGNVFTAQLSDATGSFATPTNIGTLTGTNSGSVFSLIPSMATPGTGYRIRVKASLPNVIGTDNGSDLTVTQSPSVSVSVVPIQCNGDNATVTVSASGGTAPYVGTGTFSVPAGPYLYSITDANGCGSGSTSGTITQPPAITHSQTFTLCGGESVVVGTHTYTTSGTFTDVLAAQNGCDSTVTTNLTVNSVNVGTSLSVMTITASAVGATYQWLDCADGYDEITGETGSIFNADNDGMYAVEVTQGGCTDTSACVTINTSGISDNDLSSTLQIFPNPATGSFTLTTESAEPGTITITLVDLQGRIIYTLQEQTTSAVYKKQIDAEHIGAGIYYVQVAQGDQQYTKKLVIR